MTVIIGLEHEGKVWMGGDSAGVYGQLMLRNDQPKVFRVNNFIIGYTGSYRFGQLMEHAFSVRSQLPEESDLGYLINTTIPAIKTMLEHNGLLLETSGVKSVGDRGTMLLGYAGKLYSVYENFQINRWLSDFASIGSGFEIATGAMEALDRLKLKSRIKRALEIAARWSTVVCEPFHIESI